MARFEMGTRVVKSSTGISGTIIEVMPPMRGGQLYGVVFDDGNKSNEFEVNLREDFNISDPFKRCENAIFDSYSDYSNKNTTFKITNSNNSTISSLKASKTLFRAYQFKPLLKFLNSPNKRLLVADEVGLGKTIEAGHIMLELKARNELNSVLIICPKSLQEKWRLELQEKFGLSFKIIEHVDDLISEFKSGVGFVRCIINYEKIRLPKEKEIKSTKTTNLVEFLAESPQKFSLVLCDEAHKMRNHTTQTYKGAEIIMSQADSALFLTATPIMISEENLYNLLHLLDNTRYFNYQIFKNRMEENRPFVESLTKLNNGGEFNEIRNSLTNAIVSTVYYIDEKIAFEKKTTIGELYKEDLIFNDILSLLDGEDTFAIRAKLQYLLSTMSVMNTVFSRTRKREVTTDMSQATRKPHMCKVELNSEERDEFDDVIEQYEEDNLYIDEWGEERISRGRALGLVQKKRQIASSVWAYLSEEEELDKGIDAYESKKDAKVDKLLEIINEVFKNGKKKIVIFALFRRTLKYLNIRLKKAGFNSLVIHGQIDNRAEILNRFKHDSDIHILLSSEVGSEGLDMQFCSSMVNYDLPWNPMVVEQRIGRIDRFGQKSSVVNIYNIVVSDSIQEDIYIRLLDRIGIFRNTIGDMGAILDAKVEVEGRSYTIQDLYNRMEKELFTKALTKEEKEHKIREVEQAIANERNNLDRIQKGLNDTLTNDSYFKDEINKILYNNAYVTEYELCNYLESIIEKYLTTCRLENIGDGIYEFHIPKSQPSILNNFLTQYCNNDDESKINLRQFKKRILEKQFFRLTFNQDKAYEDSSINYLNIYHPLIQASLNYFKKNEDSNKTTFNYALTSDEILKLGSKYYMGLYELISHKKVQGVDKNTTVLLPVVYNLELQEIEQNKEIVDRLYRRSQVEGCERNVTREDKLKDVILNMQYDFANFVSQEINKRVEEERHQLESDRMRNDHQTREYYNTRIKNHQNSIEEWTMQKEFSSNEEERKRCENVIRLNEGKIKELEVERDEKLMQINADLGLKIDDRLLSINLITII